MVGFGMVDVGAGADVDVGADKDGVAGGMCENESERLERRDWGWL